MLAAGDQFPNFELSDHEGEPRSFNDYSGSWFILFAFPGSGKSCDNQALRFETFHDEFKDLGVEVVGLAPQSQKKLSNFVKKHDLSYTILSDPDNELLEALEVWSEKTTAGKTVEGVVRSTFLVNPDGEIAQVWEDIKVAGHADAVLEAATEAVNASEEGEADEETEETEDEDSDESEDNEQEDSEDDERNDDESEDDGADEKDEGGDEDDENEEGDESNDESDEEENPKTTRKRKSKSSQREDNDH